MNHGVRGRLSVMMFLEFVIWGAWLPLIFGYLPSLKFDETQQALILSAFPVAAIVGMFFSNEFADRNFAQERVLAFSHFVGGLAMVGLAFTKSFWPFFLLMIVHCLLYVPTISITNSIAFANLKDAQKEFGLVRLWGTIGWIAAAWPFTFILVDYDAVRAANPQGLVEWIGTALENGLKGKAFEDATRWTYIVSGGAALALAAFSLALPHTPPKKAEQAENKLAWLEAVRLLKHPFVLILWLVTLVDAFVHQTYFIWTGRFLEGAVDKGGAGIASNWVMPVMSIGQIAEIGTMVFLGWTLKRLGWTWTMVAGILGHAARFAVYAFFPESPAMIIGVQVLHGICYAFFFATVYIFVEEFFPKDARASAQGLFNVMILGIGALTANMLWPYLSKWMFVREGATDFRNLFLVPMILALAAAVALALFFRPPRREQAPPAPAPAP
jgi:nucleoside transporter